MIFSEWLASRLKGLIDMEGVDKDKLSYVQTQGNFRHTYKNGTPCRGVKITGPKSIIPILERATKPGYFSLVFDANEIVIIFRNKSFRFERKNFKGTSGFNQAKNYARHQKIPMFYLDELGDTLWY